MCSYFRPMAQPIDTIGKAVRRGMLVKVTCKRCGNFRCYKASDLMMVLAGATIRFYNRTPDVKAPYGIRSAGCSAVITG
jgi:hypothetical protein